MRGGKREKAGRPSTWVSGCKFKDTKLIRVPKDVADRLLEIAHRMDAKEPLELVTKSKASSKHKAKQLEILKDSLTTTLEVPIDIAENIQQVIQRMEASRRGEKKVGNIFGLLCPTCKSDSICKHGFTQGKQSYKCKICGYRFTKASTGKAS